MAYEAGNAVTRKRLSLAILRLQKGRPRVLDSKRAPLNISNVAKEAGITPATIHNVYPEIAEQIRVLMGKSSRAQRDQKQGELTEARRKNRSLREENSLLVRQLTELASENARLLSENAELKAVASSLNVTKFNRS